MNGSPPTPVEVLLSSRYAQMSPGVRLPGLAEFPHLADPAVVGDLVAALQVAPRTRGTASAAYRTGIVRLLCRAAWYHGSRPAVDALVAHAGAEPAPAVAAEALGVLDGPDWRAELRALIGGLGPEPLVSLARHQDRRAQQLRHAALAALWWVSGDDAAPVLAPVLAGGETCCARAAVRAAGMLPWETAGPLLAGAADHPDREVATLALGQLDGFGAAALTTARTLAARADGYATSRFLARHGGADDVGVVADRLRFVLRRQKRRHDPWEGYHLAPFLARHRDQAPARRALDLLHAHAAALEPAPRAYLGLFVAGFEDLAPGPVDLPAPVEAVIGTHAAGAPVGEIVAALHASAVEAELRWAPLEDPARPGEVIALPLRWPDPAVVTPVLYLGGSAAYVPLDGAPVRAMTVGEVLARYGRLLAPDAVPDDPTRRPPWLDAAHSRGEGEGPPSPPAA